MQKTPSLHAVVVAGGSGTRFWPLSRKHHPKQLLNLSGEDTLLRATFTRVSSIADKARWWMVVGQAHADGCRKVAPEVPPAHVLVEPVARNTAPAIGLAAIHLRRSDPDALMVVLPADHHVSNPNAFCASLQTAAQLASQGAIVTLGIKPTHPETGYGYIQQGTKIPAAGGAAFEVARFCEKPNRERAEAFLSEGNFVWNAGIFVMQPAAYLEEVARQLPDLHKALEAIAKSLDGTPQQQAAVLNEQFTAIKGISIDYGVMENAKRVAVVPADCGWSDVGAWNALGAVVPADKAGNVVHGKSVVLDTKNSFIYASDGHMVGVVGVEGLVVVHTPDATLVVPADRAQDVREILEQMKGDAWKAWL